MKRFRCDWSHWPVGWILPLQHRCHIHCIRQFNQFCNNTAFYIRVSTSTTAAGSETALLSYSWRQRIIIDFFVDSYAILSTHRVHGTSAAWCFCGSIVQWYTGTGVALPYPNPLKLLCCRCFLNFRRVHDLAFPCYWCEMLQDMGYPPYFWKTCFFVSDTRFVIRAIYIPCLFQPLPR